MSIGNSQEEAMKSGVSLSREALSVKKIKTLFEKKNGEKEHSFEKTEESLRHLIEDNKRLLVPGVTIDQVINELKEEHFFLELKKGKPVEEVVMWKAGPPGLKPVEDESLKKILEENKFFETLEKDIFKNKEDLDAVYARSLLLGRGEHNETIENDNYYYDFAHLVDGGSEEIKKDLIYV